LFLNRHHDVDIATLVELAAQRVDEFWITRCDGVVPSFVPMFDAAASQPSSGER
jgi:hypothetical protein